MLATCTVLPPKSPEFKRLKRFLSVLLLLSLDLYQTVLLASFSIDRETREPAHAVVSVGICLANIVLAFL